MAHLDFRKALSTPEEKSFSMPAAVAVAQPQLPALDSYFPEVGLSRSAWANIVFVAIAAVGGMVCAFYFFNGSELLRAAAAWPAEFLYSRPVSTESIEANMQPNPVDRYSSDSTSRKNDETRDSSDQNFRPAQLAQFPAPTDSLASTPTTPTSVPPIVPPTVPVVPPGVAPIVPPVRQPIIPPVTAPGVPQPDSILGEGQQLVAGADTVGQSVYQTLDQTVASVLPKKVSAAPASRTVGSARKKVASARQKTSARAGATSISRPTQPLTTQLQSSGVQNQTMFGGGMGAVSGIGSIGSAGSSGTGLSGVGSPGGVSGTGVGGPGVGGVGGVGGIGGVGGLPGVGGLGGGLPGVGGIGGHH